MTLRPGTVLISETHWGEYFSPEGGAFPGEVGPFFIEGATTNDILVVKVHEVRPELRVCGVEYRADLRRSVGGQPGADAERSRCPASGTSGSWTWRT